MPINRSERPFTAALIDVLNEEKDGKTNRQRLHEFLAKRKGADNER